MMWSLLARQKQCLQHCNTLKNVLDTQTFQLWSSEMAKDNFKTACGKGAEQGFGKPSI